MTTLFTLLRKAYLALGQMEVTTATGGSTTTVIDTKLADIYGDDDLVNSTVFVIRDAAGGSAAPEGQAEIISAYIQATNTITLKSALTAAVGAGDTIGIAKNIWPLYTMIELVNDALGSLGSIVLTDTSLTTVEKQTEYTLPVDLKYKLNRVQMQTNENTNDYVDLHNWTVVPAIAGTAGILAFTEELAAGMTLKLWYEAEHPRLSAMSDKLSETIHSEYATRLIVDRALEYQTRRTSGTDNFLLQTANKAMNDVMEARRKYEQPKNKKAKILTPSNFVVKNGD
jgi:hypothetical protein